MFTDSCGQVVVLYTHIFHLEDAFHKCAHAFHRLFWHNGRNKLEVHRANHNLQKNRKNCYVAMLLACRFYKRMFTLAENNQDTNHNKLSKPKRNNVTQRMLCFPMMLAFSHATSMAANDVSNSASFQHVISKVVIVI